MNLYLVERTDKVTWDEYDSFVIAANTPQVARNIAADAGSSTYGPKPTAWLETATVQFLGTAAPDVERGVVLGSFNAG